MHGMVFTCPLLVLCNCYDLRMISHFVRLYVIIWLELLDKCDKRHVNFRYSTYSLGDVMEAELVGKYFVKPTGPAVVNAWKLCKYRAGEYWKLRRHAFNLAYWPEGADLDWEWIRGFENLKIGELRIDEPINDIENIQLFRV